MAITATRTAADQYAARVDAVLAQRTRLRGPQPPGDLFAGLPADHPMLTSDPRRPLDPNLARLASYIVPDDVIVDVGGGAGRVSLPLALRCREVINVESSVAMGTGFTANATQAGITNTRVLIGDWLTVDGPVGTVALVNHVTYLRGCLKSSGCREPTQHEPCHREVNHGLTTLGQAFIIFTQPA